MVISTHLPPPVMIDSTAVREAVTHMLCCSWAMCFSAAAFLRERPRQHELGLEDGAGPLDHAVEGGRHPALDRMKHLPLHLGHDLAGVALVPVPVEVLGHGAELDDQVVPIGPRARPRRASPATAGAGRASSSPMMIRASEPPIKERRVRVRFDHMLRLHAFVI